MYFNVKYCIKYWELYLKTFYLLCSYMWVWYVRQHSFVCLQVRVKIIRFCSLFLALWLQNLSADHQAWQQLSLSTELSLWSSPGFSIKSNLQNLVLQVWQTDSCAESPLSFPVPWPFNFHSLLGSFSSISLDPAAICRTSHSCSQGLCSISLALLL